jgi:hypothetical protein
VLSGTSTNTSTRHTLDLWSAWQARGAPIDPARLKTVGFDPVQLINATNTIIFDFNVVFSPIFTQYSLDLTHFKTIEKLI